MVRVTFALHGHITEASNKSPRELMFLLRLLARKSIRDPGRCSEESSMHAHMRVRPGRSACCPSVASIRSLLASLRANRAFETAVFPSGNVTLVIRLI